MDKTAAEDREVGEARLGATSAAPNPGLNSRDLILRAARDACFQQGNDLYDQLGQNSSEELVAPSPPHTPADAKSSKNAAAISGMLADMLVQEGLTVHERPIVQYTPRSSVPRIARQGVANRLAGQHLAHLLQQAGIDVSVEGVRQPEAESARKHAVTAALVQELSIFKKASGKQVYMNLAARTPADPSFMPSEARPQVSSAGPSSKAEVMVASGTPGDSAAQPPAKRLKTTPSSDTSESMRDGAVSEGPDKQEGPTESLKTADIDWEAASGAASDSNDDEGHGKSEHGEGLEQSDFEIPMDEEEMRQATLHFVKAILNPLYHAQVVDKDLYKKVLHKAVEKVVQTHSLAADASFLIEEASNIQKLVKEYTHHLRDP